MKRMCATIGQSKELIEIGVSFKKEFRDVFGSDILGKEFDVEMYKGGAYVSIRDVIVYVIEISYECKVICLKKFKDIDIDKVFDELVDDGNYYSIGRAYVAIRRENDEKERLLKFVSCLYENEMEYLLDEYKMGSGDFVDVYRDDFFV